ncbi:MAG TPA: sigma-70 family RNA polymerase sigma factor [Micromonosporaceae bacterium]|nr:sigma-70 family RNA polymerase sigma factor [Micromonosporaceae bacterium]
MIHESDLLAAVRAGDTTAYASLYRTHVAVARRLAHVLVRDATEAEDLVAEAFAKVLATMRRGRGPRRAFRAYLLTTLRHLRASRAGREARLELTDDFSRYETGEPFADPTVAALDRSYAARAFGKLPERWRLVLWHTEVEGDSPAHVARVLGLTPNGVAVLAHRARERLRQMYLQEHLTRAGQPPRHQAAQRLGSYVRGGLAVRERSKIAIHLAGCPACRRLHGELTEVACALPRAIAGRHHR